MIQAVIKTGGKQYIVSTGQKIKIEKLDIEEGKDVSFDEVLLLRDGEDVKVGTPLVDGAKVTGKVLSHDKRDKIIIFKYKSKKRSRVKKGHRQPFCEVEITEIKAK